MNDVFECAPFFRIHLAFNCVSLNEEQSSAMTSCWCCSRTKMDTGIDISIDHYFHKFSVMSMESDINRSIPWCPHCSSSRYQCSSCSSSTCRRNLLYSGFCQISLNDFPFKSPILCCASLSKQQGTTNPSQVITVACHNLQQWLCNAFLTSIFPSPFFL